MTAYLAASLVGLVNASHFDEPSRFRFPILRFSGNPPPPSHRWPHRSTDVVFISLARIKKGWKTCKKKRKENRGDLIELLFSYERVRTRRGRAAVGQTNSPRG